MDGLLFCPQNRKAIYISAFNLSYAKISKGSKRSSATPLSLCNILQLILLQGITLGTGMW